MKSEAGFLDYVMITGVFLHLPAADTVGRAEKAGKPRFLRETIFVKSRYFPRQMPLSRQFQNFRRGFSCESAMDVKDTKTFSAIMQKSGSGAELSIELDNGLFI